MKQWSAVFAAVLGVLVFRNRFLFSTPVYELGDTGANSIIISQAKHFGLLVGNYSRQGFSHPGPGYFYVEGFGEAFFYDLLGIVPTPWNGQILALYVLNAAFLATVALIVARWSDSWLTATTALLALVVLISLQPHIVNNAWMPYVYVPSFLLFLVASASVAAGKSDYLWAAALAGGFLMHGHAVFLLFVPATAGAALFLAWRNRTTFGKRDLAVAGPVLALFLLPVVLNTVLHWPGEFGKYISYGSSSHDDGRSIVDAGAYVYWYWWPLAGLWGLLLVLLVTVLVVTRNRLPLARAGLVLSALVTVLLAYYAYAAIDKLDDPYMGYFYWAVPLFLAVLLVMRLPLSRVHFTAPLAAAVAIMLVVPGFRTNVNDHQPAVPALLAALDDSAAGRPVIIEAGADGLGMEVPGLVNWARRTGVPACVSDPRWAFITTQDLICTPAELSAGVVFHRVEVTPQTPVFAGEIGRAGASAFLPGPAIAQAG